MAKSGIWRRAEKLERYGVRISPRLVSEHDLV